MDHIGTRLLWTVVTDCRGLLRKRHRTEYGQRTMKHRNDQSLHMGLYSILLPSWLLYNPTDLIGREGTPFEANDWSYSLHRQSPSWRFLGFSSVVRQMTGDLCTAPGSISLSPLPLADRRDWCDTRGKWPFARNPDRSGWHRHNNIKFLWPQPKEGWKEFALTFTSYSHDIIFTHFPLFT